MIIHRVRRATRGIPACKGFAILSPMTKFFPDKNGMPRTAAHKQLVHSRLLETINGSESASEFASDFLFFRGTKCGLQDNAVSVVFLGPPRKSSRCLSIPASFLMVSAAR